MTQRTMTQRKKVSKPTALKSVKKAHSAPAPSHARERTASARDEVDRFSPLNRTEVERYLESFANALTSGDTKTLTNLWQVPAFVIGPNMEKVIVALSEVEQFFSGAKEMYNQRGIMDTYPDILDLDVIDDDLVTVTVRWPYVMANGQEEGEESSSYTLKRDESGDLKMRIVTLRGEHQ